MEATNEAIAKQDIPKDRTSFTDAVRQVIQEENPKGKPPKQAIAILKFPNKEAFYKFYDNDTSKMVNMVKGKKKRKNVYLIYF